MLVTTLALVATAALTLVPVAAGPTVLPAASAADPITAVAERAVSRSITRPWVTVPAQVVAGDRLVLVVSVGSSTRTATGPAGWELEGDRTAGSMRSFVWSRTATAADAGSRVRVTLSGWAKSSVQVAAYRGVVAEDLTVASVGYTGRSTTRRTPTAVAAEGDYVTSWWSGKSGAATTWAPPASLTARSVTANSGSGRIVSRLAGSGGPVSGGTVGGHLATSDSPTGSAVAWSIVLPAGAVADPPPTGGDPITAVAESAVSRALAAPWITVPGQVVAGDRLVLVVSVGSSGRTATAPAGWDLEGDRTAGSMRSFVWSRTATAADAGSRLTVTLSGWAKSSVQLAAYRGVATGDLGVASSVYTSSGTTRRTPGVVAAEGDWVTSWWSGKSGAATTWTPPASLTSRSVTANSGSGRIVSRLADSGGPVPGGADGDHAATSNAATGSTVAWSIVLPAGGVSADTPPTAAFSYQCSGRTCSFDGSGSSDAQGPIAGWAWDFGDGASANGETVGHTFPTNGSWTVELTVTDSAGATDQLARQVTLGGGLELVTADVETTPVTHTGDSADDPAIWVHPTDPGRSLVIGNDKQGALEVYGLDGTRLQRITTATSFWGNVDVRQDVVVRGQTRDVVAAYNGGIRTYEVDPVTQALVPVGDGTGTIPTNGGEGLCSYHSASGSLYVFVITRGGRVRQYLIHDDDADGLLQGTLQREFVVGSEAEGCAADDEAGVLYVAEEDTGLWRYGAEPNAGATRTLVDAIAPGGNLAYDVEGVTIAETGPLTGHLIVSAQNGAAPQQSYFAVYDRQTNDYLGSFRIAAGAATDGCERTDGIAAYAGDLGPQFPEGLFVCQDNGNTAPAAGNQNFKLTRLEKILPVP